MEIKLNPGMRKIKEFKITEKHAAKNVGSGEVEVLSTPSMIAFMEKTAMECVQKELPEGYISVGTKVDVKHLKPAPVGENLKVTAELVEIDRRRLTFKVKAEWREEIVGEGIHERFIVNKEKFIEKLKKKIKAPI
ncbi:MAG: thioesterase family protein [archaeon GB-1867-097]|nr:thioesterase family protein [Candidatus Verstraetearchaeota archaeon]MCS7374039.1 thioesterase family protein [Candidatus Culexmicrobium thermophilum]MCS7384147.1 thioesterase family protein [Candidatus Culexmicrobium thermophilum]RLE54341.1 MAG: thioesterase [Candidatus Verstraetearchaeota archaeon]HDO20901.1 thioesterase [Candidatus Bathyarchaeota archaeon]